MEKRIISLQVVDGYVPERVRVLTEPTAGGCEGDKHCACHGSDPFHCCLCGAMFERVYPLIVMGRIRPGKPPDEYWATIRDVDPKIDGEHGPYKRAAVMAASVAQMLKSVGLIATVMGSVLVTGDVEVHQ